MSTAETSWTAILSGVVPEKTGLWSPLRFDRESYDIKNVGSYEYDEYPMFYELGDVIRDGENGPEGSGRDRVTSFRSDFTEMHYQIGTDLV